MPKNIFRGDPGFEHGEIPAVGVLVTNLGTPEAPTAAALRPYLREFLSDPRVIELPRALWQTILNLFILPFRPKKSAELYASIWTDEGSPLLVLSRRLMDKIAARMDELEEERKRLAEETRRQAEAAESEAATGDDTHE